MTIPKNQMMGQQFPQKNKQCERAFAYSTIKKRNNKAKDLSDWVDI